MLRTVIYCRCSTEEESQQEALKKQVIEAKESVKENGWLLADEYIEAKSGTTAEKRKEYQRLFEDLQSDKFDIVQIKSQDRLMRNTKDWYLFIDRLVSNGKKLYMYIERKFYTPDDALITGIKAILAEEYSKELSKKINNAHRNRQRRGESFILPPGTYGYQKLPDKSIVIVEDEAKVIRLMFHLCLSMGCGRIASVLEKEGYCDRKGEYFQEEAIRRIIRNPLRYGTVIQNKRHFDFQRKQELRMPKEDWVVHKEAIPAIVSDKVWQRANQAMDERANQYHTGEYHPKTSVGKFDLSGKIHCGHCGGCYYRTYRRRYKDNALIVEWKCQNYLRYGRMDEKMARPNIRRAPKIEKKGCDNIHLEETKLLEFLGGVCESYYEGYQIDYQGIEEKALSVLRQVLEKSEASDQRQELKRGIKKCELLNKRLMDKLLEEVISNQDYKIKKAEIDGKQEVLQEELKSIQELADMQSVVENRIEQIKKRLEDDTVKKATLAEMLDNIEQILVFEDHLQIRFCSGKVLGIQQKGSTDIHGLLEEFKDVFVLDIPLDKEFVYASKKEVERERILSYMKENPKITAKEIAKKENIGLTTANYRIKKLRQQEKIYFNGHGGHGEWVVVHKNP